MKSVAKVFLMFPPLLTLSALCLLPFAAQSSPPESASPVFIGLPGVRSIAFSPQGGLFAALPDPSRGVVQVLGRDVAETLATTGGSASGLAFGRDGELYVADAGRKAILKIAASGDTSVAADRCGGESLVQPADVAVGSTGVFFLDTGVSRICRVDGRLVTAGIPGPSALAVSSDGGTVFAASGTGEIWRMKADGSDLERLASLEAPIGGLALDERGNLYAAGKAGLVVLAADGREIKRVPFSGGFSDVVFGQADRASVFVTSGQGGSVFRIAVPYGAQPSPWERARKMRITEPVDGQILNRHDGVLSSGRLRIKIRGEAPEGPVTVNGLPAKVRDGLFESDLDLTTRETAIRAAGPGELSDQVTVLWDRDSLPRYRVSVDDNIRWLKDIATRQKPYASIFENPFLGFWREMHRKYGARVHFNIYYEMAEFNLSQMPDRYRREWQQNAGWIRLTFHARANNPDRPYIHSTGERIRDDYRLVTREIERFASKELLSDVTTIHWGEATPEVIAAIRAEGVRVLVGYFELRRELPAVSYDVSMQQLLHLMGRDYWKDVGRDLLFVRHDMVINGVPLDQVVPRLEKLAADPHQSELIELMIHEQFWYPDYVAYLPDYRQRVERAIRWVTERGYKPVFFGEGFLGAR